MFEKVLFFLILLVTLSFFVVYKYHDLNSTASNLNLSKTYYEASSDWKISYPSNMNASSSPASERISDANAIGNAVDFWIDGSTQKKETEFYDGLMITIFTSNKNPDVNLMDFVKQKNKSSSNTFDSVNEISINGIKGYSFFYSEFRGLLNIFLPYKNHSDKVLIMHIISVGENKKEYDLLYKKMLETFSFTENQKRL